MTDAGKEPGAATHQVFISYASDNKNSAASDRQVADQICSVLESQNIRCWIAHRDILPGDEWLNAIIEAAEKSKIIILVFSANTEQSQWVKDEITLALNRKIKIIPFRIENVSPQQSLRILDVRCQWMDAYTPPLEKHIESLVKIVSRHLGLEPAIPIKKETLKEQPVPNQVKPAAKERKAVKEKTMPAKDKEKPPEVVKEAIRKQEKKPKKPLLQKRILIAISTIILLTAAVLFILQLFKKESIPPGEPVFIKEMKSKGAKVKPLGNDSWEAYYEEYDITMVYIPPGIFTMGSDDGGKDEKPPHEVDLDGYWIGKYEVTFAQYDRYCKDMKIEKPGDEGWGRKNRPVINVSWDDADAYCKWLSQKTGLKFELPTEAQWEKAARGNDQRKYPWGSQEPYKNLANFSFNIGKTTPVGSYLSGASPYGLLDMAGNIWEWCSDYYDFNYYENLKRENKNKTIKNPPGPGFDSHRVIRGGSWCSYAGDLRCAFRHFVGSSDHYDDLGFRLCQD
jgi:formylglycine-generating enzyme required for sulfatase activity